MKKLFYSDKPLLQRLILFIAGFTNFIIGYALYYIFKDDKSKKWQIEFVQRGACFGFIFSIIGILYYILSFIIK